MARAGPASACRRQPLLRGAKGRDRQRSLAGRRCASDFIDITSKTNSSYDESGLLGDFRFGTPPSQGYCGTARVVSEMGVPGALLVAPGHPEKSLVLLRMKALDQYRMPPLASHVVDQASVDVLTSWIGGLSSCP